MSPESHFSTVPQEREPKTPPREVVQEVRNDSFKIAQKHVERLAVINPALLEAPEIQRQIVELARSAAKEKFPEYDFSWLNITIDKEGSIKVASLEKTPEKGPVVEVVGLKSTEIDKKTRQDLQARKNLEDSGVFAKDIGNERIFEVKGATDRESSTVTQHAKRLNRNNRGLRDDLRDAA